MFEASEKLLHVRDAFVYLIALILSICVHEFGHAFVADKLGDPLPRAQGRVTLNPLAHIDPVGTLLFPLIGFFAPAGLGSRILGWGKPVQVSLSARAMTRRFSVRTSHLIIALAGPIMNLLFALVLSGVFVILLRHNDASLDPITEGVAGIVGMNIGLAFFNLIPCPPLDGGAVLRGLLPRELLSISDFLDRYGYMIFFALLFTGALRYLTIPARMVWQVWFQHLTAWALPR
jgi:Zn-dependent protease